MKLAILILKEEELLDKLIKSLNENNFHNLTTINSECVSSNGNNKNVRVFSSLRYLMNYFYDEECGYYVCLVNLDEDEMEKFMSSSFYNCPYYQLYDEYKIVKKQM